MGVAVGSGIVSSGESWSSHWELIRLGRYARSVDRLGRRSRTCCGGDAKDEAGRLHGDT